MRQVNAVGPAHTRERRHAQTSWQILGVACLMAKFLARVKPSSPTHIPGRATDAWTVGPISEPAEVPDGRVGREIAIIGVWLLGRSEDKRHLGQRSCEIIEIDRLGDGTVRECDRLCGR